MKKTKVALLYGGRSVEHGVSINSAKNIFTYIDKNLFEVIPIGITKNGQWFHTKAVDKNMDSGDVLSISLNPANPVFSTSSGKSFAVDIVFPVLHGTDGEDGSIQGMLKALSLPIVGTSVLGSAVSMNKILSKKILHVAGIPVVPFLAYHYNNCNEIDFDFIKTKLGLPFMAKAASLGSSVGVTKVNNKADFEKAFAEAFRFDQEILFESFIKGREIECAILGNNPAEASLPGEIIINPKYEFYTFDAKYVDATAVEIKVPAALNDDQIKEIQQLSLASFNTLQCEDFARIDLFLAGEKIYVNEINTIPGFTNASMYPMMWKQHGISFTDLISRLIALAKERHQQAKRIERDFQSSLNY
ncbi:MAG TPA: D-alanine--D-alanine ligase family protein [Cyclobacteriaceae bacterium]|nr:D-alanine--D-alanine ligase family protein [Cyclobacteriaceae bacterium]